MATEKAAKKEGFNLMRWYESYQGQRVVGIVYSVGAAVVILGALFKIQHYPGASIMLNLGMGTEVLLFVIGVMDKPHASFHWEEVFPQLVNLNTVTEEEAEKIKSLPRPDLASVTGGTAAVPAAAAQAGTASRANVPALKDEELAALKDGIADLAKTASQLTELGKVAQSGVKLNEKLAAAEAATDSYASATATLAENYAKVNGEVQQTVAKTQAYAQSVEQASKNAEQVGKNLAALNSVYELQLQTANAQVETAKAQVEAQKSITAATKEVADSQIAFAKEAAAAQAEFAKGAQQLQKQVNDLNAVYGNMLNALA